MRFKSSATGLSLVLAIMLAASGCGDGATAAISPSERADPATDRGARASALSGEFQDSPQHSTTGRASVETDVSGNRALKFENFKTDKGPKLVVYLSETVDPIPGTYVSLGALSAFEGEQSYVVPEGTDLTRYKTVLIWCEEFSVLFGSAELAEAPSGS
jgi:hypothetical protein